MMKTTLTVKIHPDVVLKNFSKQNYRTCLYTDLVKSLSPTLFSQAKQEQRWIQILSNPRTKNIFYFIFYVPRIYKSCLNKF